MFISNFQCLQLDVWFTAHIDTAYGDVIVWRWYAFQRRAQTPTRRCWTLVKRWRRLPLKPKYGNLLLLWNRDGYQYLSAYTE